MLRANCNCLNYKNSLVKSFTHEINIIEIKRIFSSSYITKEEPVLIKKAFSEPNVQYSANYDDLCGSFSYNAHPALNQYVDPKPSPQLLTWTFTTVEDMKFIKQNLFNRDAILLRIEEKLDKSSIIFKDLGKTIFLNLLWEIFKYMRDENFTGKEISAMLAIFYKTYQYSLLNPWITPLQVLQFLKDTLNFHIFLKPQESDQVFTFVGYDRLLELVNNLYIDNLEIIRMSCLPQYKTELNFKSKIIKFADKTISEELKNSKDVYIS